MTAHRTAPTARFYLPNAKVGVEYVAQIQAPDATAPSIVVQELTLPATLGLHFDPERGEVRGTPLMAGEYRLPLRWHSDADDNAAGTCLLIVNPDPQRLWQVIEPPADAPYPKPHRASQRLQTEALCLIAASQRGRSHAHAGGFREDDVYIELDTANGWSLLIVADGAGSAPFAREGSRLAVTTAGAHLFATLTGATGAHLSGVLANWEAEPEASATALGHAFHTHLSAAARQALQAIEHEAATRHAQPRDYATTLLAAVVKRQSRATCIASLWIGDGAIAAYGPRGRVRLMGVPDSGEFAGQTRFLDRALLDDPGFAKRIGLGYFQDLTAVLLLTDGISDPRFETDNDLADPERWDALWDDLAPALANHAAEHALNDWLGFFSPGYHDDRTLALYWAQTPED